MVRGSALLPWVIRPARRAGPTSWSRQARPLPWFRADGRYSVPLFAAQSRHEKPYPPISKIKFRLAFERQDGNSMPHSPAQRKRGFWEIEVLRAGAQSLTRDARRETRMETSRRETMRQCGFANVSSSHVSARLSSIVSCPRAHAHSASGGRVRGTSLRICDVAGKWHKMRNVFLGHGVPVTPLCGGLP